MMSVRRPRRAVVCALAALLPIAAARVAGGQEIIDRILAVVAGNLIMQSDVNAARDFRLVSVPADVADPDREILHRLIDRTLILAEVERYAPPEPDAGLVDRQFQAVRGFFANAQAFDAALARVGFTEAHLRETLRQNLRVFSYLEQRFTGQPPSEDDLTRYYREHQQAFLQNGQPIPFEQARARVLEAAVSERRQRLVDDWVAGLRRRTEVRELEARN